MPLRFRGIIFVINKTIIVAFEILNFSFKMFRKIFNFIHNTKPEEIEKYRESPEFPFKLIKKSSSSMFSLHAANISKNSGSSQEPLITPKDSEFNIEKIERFEKIVIFSPSNVIRTKNHDEIISMNE